MSKLDEIKKALQAATPGPWEVVDIGGIEIARDYKYKDGKHSAYWIAEMYQDEDMDEDQVYADAHLIANSPEWLGFLLDELERLEREYAEERAAHNAHVTELCELGKENRKLLEERDKLIEVLRWYAATENWRLSLTHMLNDRGKRARDILKSIGVTVDVYD